MAPVSSTWRHQLGEATTNLWRNCHRAALTFLFLTLFLTTKAEAKTDPIGGVWSDLSIGFLHSREAQRSGPLQMASFTSTPAYFHASPAGGSSKRMQIPIPNHPAINHYIRQYKDGNRRTFLEALDRSWSYVPVMEEIFRSEGVPEELIYLALVESCFRGKASYRGAGGYWQLLSPTARSMGLRVDAWVDERVDPIKSTRAAAQYLKTLHDRFGSWPLALAAYNAGDAAVTRCVQRYGSNDFWTLYNRKAFSRTTRQYVPKVLAAIQIARDLESHGFRRPESFEVFDFEPISVRKPLKLEEVARWIQVPVSDLRVLNPSLRKDSIPPGSEYTLRLPLGAHDRFSLAYRDYVRK